MTEKNSSKLYFRTGSTTLNPETCADQVDADFVIPSLSKVQKVCKAWNQNKQILRSNFSMREGQSSERKSNTIYRLINDRHKFEEAAQIAQNRWGYISHKLEEWSRQKKMTTSKNLRIQQIKKEKTDYKLFMRKTISLEQKQDLNRKQSMKSQVLSHRERKSLVINTKKMEKQLEGQLSRNESRTLRDQKTKNSQILTQRNQWAVESGRRMNKFRQEKQQIRLAHSLAQARNNYQDRWMKQFINREKAEASCRRKTNNINKKIKNLLESINSP